MDKKKIVLMVVLFILLVGTGALILLNDNKIASTITLDINPSMEINLDKDEKIVNVIALNEDAKDVIDSNLKGKTLDNALEVITNNVVDKGYAYERELVVLIHTTGSINTNDVTDKISSNFSSRNVNVVTIAIENITEEDKKLAKEYNITPAKANYIKSVAESNNNLEISDLINKSVNELNKTKETGLYCEKGYTFKDPDCVKEIGRTKAKDGEICPENYSEYEGVCYKSVPYEETGNLICTPEFDLIDGKCTRKMTRNAVPASYNCTKGEAKTRLELGQARPEDGIANEVVCVDYSRATHPMTPCELPANDPTERTSAGGKCYWHRAPVIAAGCPGKIQVNGFCWDDATNVLICVGARDGKQYSSRDEYCEDSIKYYDPIVTEYKCEEEDFNVEGKECIKVETNDPYMEFLCPEGSQDMEGRCLVMTDTANKIGGLVCDGDDELRGNECIAYERMEAKHN